MSAFLGLVSVLGFMGCIIWLIYSLIKKKKLKNSLIGLGAFFIVFVIALAISSPKQTPEKKSSGTPQKNSSISTTKQTTEESTTKPITTKAITTKTTTTITTTNATTKPVNNSNISIVDISSVVKAGEHAYVSIKGLPNTDYSISVYYSSGASKADGLEPKKSDGNGNVSWTWEVGARTKPGTYKICIAGGGNTITKYFEVT